LKLKFQPVFKPNAGLNGAHGLQNGTGAQSHDHDFEATLVAVTPSVISSGMGFEARASPDSDDDVIVTGVNPVLTQKPITLPKLSTLEARRRNTAGTGWRHCDSPSAEILSDQDIKQPGAWYKVCEMQKVSRNPDGLLEAVLKKCVTNEYDDELSVWVEQEQGINALELNLWITLLAFRQKTGEVGEMMINTWKEKHISIAVQPPLCSQEASLEEAEGIAISSRSGFVRHNGLVLDILNIPDLQLHLPFKQWKDRNVLGLGGAARKIQWGVHCKLPGGRQLVLSACIRNTCGAPQNGHLDLPPSGDLTHADGHSIPSNDYVHTSSPFTNTELQDAWSFVAPFPGEDSISIDVYNWESQRYCTHWADPDKHEFFLFRPMETWHRGTGECQGPRIYGMYLSPGSNVSHEDLTIRAKRVVDEKLVGGKPVVQRGAGNYTKVHGVVETDL
jgi:hypothetical protein